ncbi:MAG: WcaI family glycosyltransferase, partial [Alphaproteobacteria bacterium]
MKILIYGINYAPEPTGIGKFSGDMGAWLAARGHAVRGIAAPPYYPAWKRAEGYSRFWRRERLDGVGVWRCPLYVPRRQTGRNRLVHLASFAASSFPVAMWQAVAWRPDLVLAVAPTLFSAPAATYTAWLCDAKSWLHFQDLEIDAAFDLGLLPMRAPLRRAVFAVERWLLRRFARVSTISPAMRDRLAAKGVDPARLTLFSNWVDTDEIRPLRDPSPLRAELDIAPEMIVALYSGNLGEKQGLDVILDAARRHADNARLRYVICGEGAAAERVRAAAVGLENLRVLPLQPVARLNALLNLADIHLLPQRADAAALVLPSKLTGIMASGRPVVAGAAPGTDLARAVDGCGIAVPPDDADAFAAAIAALA